MLSPEDAMPPGGESAPSLTAVGDDAEHDPLNGHTHLIDGVTSSPSSQARDALDALQELHLERLRLREALCARDTVAKYLAEACSVIHQKNTDMKRLQRENEELDSRLKASRVDRTDSHTPTFGKHERQLSAALIHAMYKKVSETGKDDCGVKELHGVHEIGDSLQLELNEPFKGLQIKLNEVVAESILYGADTPLSPITSPTASVDTPLPLAERLAQSAMEVSRQGREGAAPEDPAFRIAQRNSRLAILPLPSGIPEDALKPLMIPSPHTLHEFLGIAPALLRTQLGNYRVFQQLMTSWCTEREEHGYLLTPAFKCSTNPRVTTAHRWIMVDFSAKLDKPTECFYNKDGKLYYAGIYRIFCMDDLSTQEWDSLSTETSQALIRETLAGRKNTSPQNIYETGQLYAAGALRVACLGLQCVGFNDALYRALLEHAARCAQTGKWRPGSSGAGAYGGPPGSPTASSVASGPMSAMMSPGLFRAPFGWPGAGILGDGDVNVGLA